MELRRDPITQSWVISDNSGSLPDLETCPFCPGQGESSLHTIYSYPKNLWEWQVKVVPHPRKLYGIEGQADRRADGIYDRMQNVGAHEVVVEHPSHDLILSRQSAHHIALVLQAYVVRLMDLKRDPRFRYITIFRNQGLQAGQDLSHPHSQITATPFIPRRVGYELRSCRQHFEKKERCLFCDIIQQELTQQVRLVASDDRFVAFCPFASRVPYETWMLPVQHHASFEEDLVSAERRLHLACFLKNVLQQLDRVAPAHHLVLHSCPNTAARPNARGYWKSLAEDYHWHFEILPIIPSRSKSYSLKEVYYNSLYPEAAAPELRCVPIKSDDLSDPSPPIT